jgi:hypothetical protein
MQAAVLSAPCRLNADVADSSLVSEWYYLIWLRFSSC